MADTHIEKTANHAVADNTEPPDNITTSFILVLFII